MRITGEGGNLKENLEATEARLSTLEGKRRNVRAILASCHRRLDALIAAIRELARDAKRYAKGGE